MKRLTDDEIRQLAIDELQEYSAYLKRVQAHEKGAAGELRRIRAELSKRGKPAVQQAPEPMSVEAYVEYLFSPEWAAELDRILRVGEEENKRMWDEIGLS